MAKKMGAILPDNLDDITPDWEPQSIASANSFSDNDVEVEVEGVEKEPDLNCNPIAPQVSTQTLVSHPCKLYVEVGITKPPVHVANDIYEESLKQHHTKPIPPDLGVVTLVEIIVVDALLPVPEPSCRVLKDAKGYFLLWPRRLIVVESFNESEPTNLCPPSIRKRKLSTLQPQKAQHNVVEVDEMSSFVKLLFTKLSGHSHFLTYNFAAPKPIFGVGKLVTVCWVDFIDMCRLNMLPDTIMSLYQCFLFTLVQKRSRPWIGFLCPEHMQDIMHTREERLDYLKVGLLGAKVIFLLPLLHEEHWRLVAINKTTKTVYWMDPLHLPPLQPVLDLVKEALDIVNEMGGSCFKVVEIKYKKQQGQWECGYYTMLYALEVINSSKLNNNFPSIFKTDSSPFTRGDIKIVCNNFAGYLINSRGDNLNGNAL